jgi:UDP-GlcNAc:undecaprenyl-phosphate GlcNAc-1-phosphate transferase
METILREFGPLLLAFGLCVGLIALLIRPARAWGWVDRPTTRKHHRTPVPLVGGAAMGAAYGLSVLMLPEKPDGYLELLIAVVLLALVGLYDDLRAVRPAFRFIFQIGAVLVMALGGEIVLGNLGDLFGLGDVALTSSVAFLFTLFCVVGVINALNMSDGLDGLAGGLALIAAGWLLVLVQSAPSLQRGSSDALLILVMVIAGFLCFNLRHPWRARASVFMGDAGSTMLGFVLAWFLVHLSQGPGAVMVPMTAVWILAVPLMDTIAVMIRRIRAGHSPFAADRQHLHHLVLGLGLSDGQTTALLLAVALTTGAVGVAAYGLDAPEHLQFYAFLVLFGLYYRVTTRLWERQRIAVALAETTATDRRRVPSAKAVVTRTAFRQEPARNED